MKTFAISFYFITGAMVGVELQRRSETGAPVLVIDLFILRVMFEVEDEDDE